MKKLSWRRTERIKKTRLKNVCQSYTWSFTGKSLSEALIFASTNQQYDNGFFIELQVQYMKIPSSNLGRTCCVQKLFLTFRTIFVRNMFVLCSAKRRASDKDLPIQVFYPVDITKVYSFLYQCYAQKWMDFRMHNYRTRAIITRGLYTFYPLFEVHLCTMTFGLIFG
jgi:hypothetical protein